MLREFGVMPGSDYEQLRFSGNLSDIYFNTLIQRTIDAQDSSLISQITHIMRKKGILVDKSLIDNKMFITPEGFISIVNGVYGGINEYQKEYEEWISLENRGPSYFTVTRRLFQLNAHAQALHRELIDELKSVTSFQGPSYPKDPENWLLSESTERARWKEYQQRFSNIFPLMNNATARYYSFMNDVYPVGFGLRVGKENPVCLFHRLSNK